MLKPTRIADTASVNQLIKLWAARYMPDLSVLPAEKGQFPIASLMEYATEAGRSQTVEQARRLLKLHCQIAGLKTNSLFSYLPNIVNLAEARQLADSVEQVYSTMLEVYLQQPPPSRYLRFMTVSSDVFSRLALSALMLPTIIQLAEAVEPAILQLQAQHLCSSNRRSIGFMTTQFHFSTRELLKHLSPCEQVLLSPYLKFVEEQVCIPWQRICQAAEHYSTVSPTFVLVEQMLPNSQTIAEEVYRQASGLHGQSCSQRGAFSNPEIAASTIRDLNMIQAYLWLCLLENDLTPIEQELLPLCQMVFPTVGVSWTLVESVLQLLVQEIQARVKPDQLSLLLPYTRALQARFAAGVPELPEKKLLYL
ncbi:hypothetical protein HJG54_17685 [Leptolyngbya sp. NK1-12]|uniref:Phycobilisome protein n=1 Tax=Leptolyngbya sp. NK1-12 TaxID=2547451 RepID=A0AA96WFM0_9CYAN|nr:hypothetical protein [Leptolyngbya sp. NK1-12]WNZ24503.1 hypothetical protein HJG54_17685 [Leptolyngbya sp. NK1-12]